MKSPKAEAENHNIQTDKNTAFKQLNQDLLEAPWHVADIFSNIDDKYDYWNGRFESIVNEHAPIKRKRVRRKDIPYMTLEWKKAIRNKRRFAIYFAKNRTPENFELKRKYGNIATRERRTAIKEYWNTKSEEIKSKPREFYNPFRPFISTTAEDSIDMLKNCYGQSREVSNGSDRAFGQLLFKRGCKYWRRPF